MLSPIVIIAGLRFSWLDHEQCYDSVVLQPPSKDLEKTRAGNRWLNREPLRSMSLDADNDRLYYLAQALASQ